MQRNAALVIFPDRWVPLSLFRKTRQVRLHHRYYAVGIAARESKRSKMCRADAVKQNVIVIAATVFWSLLFMLGLNRVWPWIDGSGSFFQHGLA
jgi:hypothetical protein